MGVVQHPQLLANGIDGQGIALLPYSNYQVVLNCGKMIPNTLLREIYGLKKAIVMDSPSELGAVKLVDGKLNELAQIGQKTRQDYDNMIDEAVTFADLIEHETLEN